MPVGGKLLLKGGEALLEQKKSSKKRKKTEVACEGEEGKAEGSKEDPSGPMKKPTVNPLGITTGGKTYEDEFNFEKDRIKSGQVKNTPWGSSYRAAPEILHGYSKKVTGKTAEERLDMRAATKSDKFAK